MSERGNFFVSFVSLPGAIGLYLATGCGNAKHGEPTTTMSSDWASETRPEFEIRAGTTDFPSGVSKYSLVGLLSHTSQQAICTGTLISRDVILTAAHCVCDPTGNILQHDALSFQRIGASEGNTAVIRSTQITKHPTFSIDGDGTRHGVDIALVKVESELSGYDALFANLLYRNPSGLFSGNWLDVVGYGQNQSGSGAGVLRKGIQVFSNYTYFLGESPVASHLKMLSGPTNQIVCKGDSGGPAFLGSQIVGTVRSGNKNGVCDAVTETFHVSVAMFVDWIDSTREILDNAASMWYQATLPNPFSYGGNGWKPIVGNWDGTVTNRTTTIGMFEPATATFYLRNSNTRGGPDITPFAYGAPTWLPVAGDWDGDRKTTIGVFDPATATWYLRNRNSAGAPDISPFAYGGANWKPVVGDWDGDGITTIGVFDPATATWYLRNSNSPGAPDIAPFAYGGTNWKPVVGDWNGDGITTIGVVNPATNTWYLRNHNNSGPPEIAPFDYGAPGWLPLAGDWDGLGASKIGVLKP